MNYDLSQYLLQDGNTLLFPLTKEEVSQLVLSVEDFSAYIRLPFYAKLQNKKSLQKVVSALDMEDNYWFLNTQWVCVDVKARAIVGLIKLEKVDQFNKIVLHVNEEKCVGITKNDVLQLFYKFLSVNNFCNIIVEDLDKKVVANEN